MNRTTVEGVNQLSGENAEAVFESIHTVMHLFRSGQYRALRDGPHDLTHMEGKLLGFFTRNPAATLSDLVAHSGRDKGQLARLIKSLKDRGLMEARKDAGDRRNVRLHLTDDGRAVHRALHRQMGRLEKVAVKGLSDEERRHLIALLERVRGNLEAAS